MIYYEHILYRKSGDIMVNYPNKKKAATLTTNKPDKKKSATHRGMNLEEDLNLTNQYYLSQKIGVIYKKPTPIQIVKVDYPVRSAAKISEAYFKTPSTTDYNGLYKGKYIDFEAKETKKTTFPFANIYLHQIEHLNNVIKHDGIAFVIIAFTTINEVYLIDASYIIDAYYNSKRKSVNYDFISKNGYLIRQGYNPRLDYLKIVDEVYFRRQNV